MSKKGRKPLDDALAAEFVYGTPVERQVQPQEDIEPPVEPSDMVVEQPPSLSQEKAPPKPQPMPESTAEPTPIETAKNNLLLSLAATSTKEPTVRITVDLAESLHRKLSVLSAKTGRKKADIVRVLLEDLLKSVET